jgi:hypothetical protein
MTSARVQPAERRMAPVDVVLISAVIGVGFAAARLADPMLWVVTPFVAVALYGAAILGTRRRERTKAISETPLPPRLERAVADAFASMPPSVARTLLGDVVRHARSLFDSFAGQLDGQRLTRDVSDLVEACCDIARDHARLDAVLPAVWEPALAPAAARGAADDARGDELRRRGDASRELLTERLRAAAAILEQMALEENVERGGAAAQRVAELTSELSAEAAARRHAAQEIQKLMTAGE